MERLHRWFRWLVLVPIGFAASTYAAALLQEWFRSQGWLDDPSGRVAQAVSLLGHVAAHPAFPWLTVFSGGLAVGAWLDFVVARASRAERRARSADLLSVGAHATHLASVIEDWRRDADGTLTRLRQGLGPRVMSLLFQYRERGIPVPARHPMGTEEDLTRFVNYLRYTGELLSAGQRQDAIRWAEEDVRSWPKGVRRDRERSADGR